MRACEGCRRRKIKCDAATTNTWPCAACIRLKLHCVRPNGFDGAADPQVYEPPPSELDEPSQPQDGFSRQLSSGDQQLLAHPAKSNPAYQQASYQDTTTLYQSVQYTEPQNVNVTHGVPYADVSHPVSVDTQRFPPQNTFPTPPPMQHSSHTAESPEAYHNDYAQQDLADLLGSLKVDEAGTGGSQCHVCRWCSAN